MHLLEPLESRLLLSVGGVNTNLWIRLGDNMTPVTLDSKEMAELKDSQHLDYTDDEGQHVYDSSALAKTEGVSLSNGGDFAAVTEMAASVSNFDGRHLCKADGNALLEWFVDVVPIKDLPDVVCKSAIAVGGLNVPVNFVVSADVQATSSASYYRGQYSFYIVHSAA